MYAVKNIPTRCHACGQIKNFNYIGRDIAKVFNRRESCNDGRVFGPKAHSSVPLARYT